MLIAEHYTFPGKIPLHDWEYDTGQFSSSGFPLEKLKSGVIG